MLLHVATTQFAPTNSTMQCLTPVVNVLGVNIYSPVLLPLAVVGASIGFLTFSKIRANASSLHGSTVFSWLFFLFGCMNTSGLFANCFFMSFSFSGGNNPLSFVAAYIDGVCTSCVSFSFLICGFVLIGLLKENWFTYLITIGGYVAIAYGWYSAFVHNDGKLFLLLYLTLTEVGSVTFFVLAILYLIKKRTIHGFGWLALALLSLVLGIIVLMNSPIVCEKLSVWLSAEVIWYFFSDSGLFCLAMFYLSMREVSLPLRDHSAYFEPFLAHRGEAAPLLTPSAPPLVDGAHRVVYVPISIPVQHAATHTPGC